MAIDIDNELVILLPDHDTLSDTEEIDYSYIRKIEERMCDVVHAKGGYSRCKRGM